MLAREGEVAQMPAPGDASAEPTRPGSAVRTRWHGLRSALFQGEKRMTENRPCAGTWTESNQPARLRALLCLGHSTGVQGAEEELGT